MSQVQVIRMVGCSAPNCNSNSRRGNYKFYRFPTNLDRRNIWAQNCQRENWFPTPNNYLCNVHFEQTQFELKRSDGRRKLSPFAIPTIFRIPSVINDNQLNESALTSIHPVNMTVQEDEQVRNDLNSYNKELLLEIEKLKMELHLKETLLESQKHEVISLQKDLDKRNAILQRFLSEEQIQHLLRNNTNIKWTDESVLKALKIRFALGKHGYNYLHENGYPCPSYSTLNRRVQQFQIHFGILDNVLKLLHVKVNSMTNVERGCQIMIDEMEISDRPDYDKHLSTVVGNITLGDDTKRGHHLTAVLLRGLNTKWKQIVALHVTGPSTSGEIMQKLIVETITACQSIGLLVLGITSDMGSNNKAMWASLGIGVSRSERKTSFQLGGQEIHCFADIAHLVKNWRTAICNDGSRLILPDAVTEEEGLITNIVRGEYIKILFEKEKSNTGLRLLHHLTENCITPSHYEKMNVGLALRYLSVKTAAALETAVSLQILPPEALTTAWFIRLLSEWMQLLMSRTILKSITKNNKDKKYEFLEKFIAIIQNTTIGNGWKPLNTGSILTTLSFIKLTKKCFAQGYNFVLGSRMSQDALENVFSQIRRKAGSTPTALSARRAVRLILISQFMSDLGKSNYLTDSDFAIVNFKDIVESDNLITSEAVQQSTSVDVEDRSTSVEVISTANTNIKISDRECNSLYYLGGACITYVLKRKICCACKTFLTDVNEEDSVESKFQFLTQYSDFGGLKYMRKNLFQVVFDMEIAILQNEISILDGRVTLNTLVERVVKQHIENAPMCCSILTLLLKHFVVIRGYSFKRIVPLKRKGGTKTGSASTSKKFKL